MRWISRHLGLVLLLAVTALTVGPLVAAWWAQRHLTGATTLPFFSLAAAWGLFLYQQNSRIRVWFDMLLAQFGNRETSISVDARLLASDKVTYNAIVDLIRHHYNESSKPVKAVSAVGQMVVYMPPGWSVRLVLSGVTEPEQMVSTTKHERDLRFVMEDTLTSIGGAKRLLRSDVLPLLDHISADLDLPLDSVRLTIRFPKGFNPYLSAYFKNIDLANVTVLKCVIREGSDGASATISRDAIVLTAPRLIELNGLVDKHLGIRT